jgi:hypothetical protein
MLLTLQLISNPERISGKNSVSVSDFLVCEMHNKMQAISQSFAEEIKVAQRGIQLELPL